MAETCRSNLCTWTSAVIWKSIHLPILSCGGSNPYLTKLSIFCVRLWLLVCFTIASGLQARENRSPLPSLVSSVLMSLFTPNTYCLLVATIICLVQMWTKTRSHWHYIFRLRSTYTLDKDVKKWNPQEIFKLPVYLSLCHLSIFISTVLKVVLVNFCRMMYICIQCCPF
jgi:hypothetical protein